MSLADLIDIVSRGGLVAFILLVLYAGHRGWWVWAREIEEKQRIIIEERKEAEEWKYVALRSTNLAEILNERALGRG